MVFIDTKNFLHILPTFAFISKNCAKSSWNTRCYRVITVIAAVIR